MVPNLILKFLSLFLNTYTQNYSTLFTRILRVFAETEHGSKSPLQSPSNSARTFLGRPLRQGDDSPALLSRFKPGISKSYHTKCSFNEANDT